MEYLSIIPNYANTIIIAALTLLVMVTVGKIVEKIAFKVIKEIEFSSIIRRATDIRFSFESFIGKVLKWTIIFSGIIASLKILGIQNLVLNVLLIFFGTIIGISILLSINDWIPNSVAYFRLKKHKLKLGQCIECQSISGEIIRKTNTHILIKTKKNDTFLIPNSTLIRNL